jgi:hypothetical protein
MQRPGVMAPPDLYHRPTQAGLMSPAAGSPEPIELKYFLWTLALALAALELCLELAG